MYVREEQQDEKQTYTFGGVHSALINVLIKKLIGVLPTITILFTVDVTC